MKRKKVLISGIILLVVLLLVFAGYNIYRYPALLRNLPDNSLSESETEALRNEILSQPDKKILVAYFSYSGTTRNVANAISERTGADLFEIVPQDGYSDVYMESNSEIRRNERPVLTEEVENMEEYNIVFVGYPIWWHAVPAPVNTFLESYDLTGKLIIPFCTSGGSGIEETMPTFLQSCEGLAVYGERRISSIGQLDGWLEGLGLSDAAGQGWTEQEGLTGAGTVPEEIQNTGHTVTELESLPTYEYVQQEIEVYNNGQKIYGIAYIPDTGTERVPLAICAHGLGGSYRSNIAYAEQLAMHGIAAYCFDFRGGGGSRSDGETTEMSVMTEVSDLEAILSAASLWDFVDKDRIILLGTSQGGITSAIAAARHTDEIKGLVLMYPAFLVGDAVHEQFDSLEEVPDSFRFNWITAGRPYVEDMWDYDVYDEIGNYTDKVLLMHGNADSIVPISYSDLAAETYEDVDYYVIDGAGHGFNGDAFDEAIRHIFDYLQKIGVIHTKNPAAADSIFENQ